MMDELFRDKYEVLKEKLKNDHEKAAEKWAEKQAKKRLEQVNKRREAKKQTGSHGQVKKQTWHVSKQKEVRR